LKWHNIAVAAGLSAYAHGWAAALFFRFDEQQLGVVGVVGAIASALLALGAGSEASDSTEAHLLAERRRLEKEVSALQGKLLEKDAEL
jgi:hypothetical protein